MPLEHSKSDAARSRNIAELIRAGHDPKQAEAAAYRIQREASDAAHAAGILLRSKSGRALFLKRQGGDHAGEWCCPGGSIEAGETPEQAAHREMQEETGYPAGDLTQIDEGDGFVTFTAEIDEFEPVLNAEHSEAKWAQFDAPPEPLHPGVAATLKKVLARAIEAGKRESEAERASEAAGREEAEAQRQAQAILGAQDVREVDANGWYEVKDNPISKAGVFQYSGKSIGGAAEPTRMYNVLLPPEELGSEETIKSFRLLPWTDDHPGALLGKREDGLVPADEKGIRGVIGQDIRFDNDILYANVKVFSEALARKIAAGKRELSCGYRCDFVPQEGFYQGKPYQYVQRNIRGNHQASVDKGRRGPDIRVLDAAEHFTFALDMKEPAMAEKRKDEAEGTVDAETEKFIRDCTLDSFNSLVGELEKKGYSKEYATKIAGKVAAEKGMTGHHDSTDSTGAKSMPAVADATETKTEEERKKEAADRKAARDARDAKRAARDARRAKDEMSSEEEEAEDAAESAEDADEEKEDEKDDTKEARDRRSARDRRHGARDARKGARDKAAKDKGKGMDAAEITALVQRETAKATADATAGVRRDAIAAQKLYGRLSPVIGAFDHDEMSHRDMAAYGLKKLGAPEATDPVTALDFYLAGRSAQVTPTRQRMALDSAGDSFVDKYLAA